MIFQYIDPDSAQIESESEEEYERGGCEMGCGGTYKGKCMCSIVESQTNEKTRNPYTSRGRTPEALTYMQSLGLLQGEKDDEGYHLPHPCLENHVRKTCRKNLGGELPKVKDIAEEIRSCDEYGYSSIKEDELSDAQLVLAATKSGGYQELFYSFCREEALKDMSWWHCKRCTKCVHWKEWHCKVYVLV
jgi:hypothetical protein